jgi:hypothetical protein
MHEDVEVFSESDYVMSCHVIVRLIWISKNCQISQEQSKCREFGKASYLVILNFLYNNPFHNHLK